MSTVLDRPDHTSDEAPQAPSPPRRSRRRFVPIHPFLFALFPGIFLFTQNIWLTAPSALVTPAIVMLGCTVAALAVCRLVYRDTRKSALTVSGAVLIFGSYGFVRSELPDFAQSDLARDATLLGLCAVLVAGIAWTARRMTRHGREITVVVNVIAACLLVMTAVPPAYAKIRSAQDARAVVKDDAEFASVLAGGPATPDRDVYYLIFDRYPGLKTLAGTYGFDNEPFLSSLEKLGFFVADQSTSNYPSTPLSLASSLNMTYLSDLGTALGRDYRDYGPIVDRIQNHRVGRLMKRLGYRYVHVASEWDPSARAESADEIHEGHWTGAFGRHLVNASVISPLSRHTGLARDQVDGRRIRWNGVRQQFDAVADVASDPRPTFTFGHFLLPHEPYVFGADGSYQNRARERSRPLWEIHNDQLTYANRQILELVERLVDTAPSQRPIIILQSDEGAHPVRMSVERQRFWGRVTDEELGIKFRILNAFLVPKNRPAEFYRTITPVNSFRVLFNHLTGSDLPLLPDRNYVYPAPGHVYNYTDVTARVRPLR